MSLVLNETLVNPKLLVWARRTIGLSQAEVASKISSRWKKFSPSELDKWETDSVNVTLPQLQYLSQLYKRPLACFFLETVPTDPPMPTDFRTIRSTTVGSLSVKARMAIRWARGIQDNALYLSSNVNQPISFHYPTANVGSSPSMMARDARTNLGLDFDIQKKFRSESYFFEYLRDKLESFGLLILKTPPKYSFDTKEAKALTITDQEPFLILINNQEESVAAKTFSLLHEFGHILIKQPGLCGFSLNDVSNGKRYPYAEKYCNKFAADFLLPTNDLQGYLSNAPISTIENLDSILELVSKDFKVSKSVVLYKLNEIRAVQTNVYLSKLAFWASLPPKKRSTKMRTVPHQVALRSVGKTFWSLVFESLNSGKITHTRASELLDLKESNLSALRETP